MLCTGVAEKVEVIAKHGLDYRNLIGRHFFNYGFASSTVTSLYVILVSINDTEDYRCLIDYLVRGLLVSLGFAMFWVVYCYPGK